MKRILLIFLISSCSVSKQTLYQKEIKNNEGIKGFTALEIFSTGGTDELWGIEKDDCKSFTYSTLDKSMNMEMIRQEKIRNNDELSDTEMSSELPEISLNVKVRKPKNSIHLQVKNMNCEWIGMGIGWASWAGKNIVPALEHAAIEFYARVDGNPIYALPIVFILEDYSSKQCYATANYLGIEGGVIGNEWTKIIIPLSTFSYDINDEIDLTNIKQIMLQAFNKVDVYIDEIRLVPFDFKYKKVPAQLTIQDTIFPINILDVNKEAIFGIDERYCSNFKINPEKKSINISIESDICDWKNIAISWNSWMYTDLSNDFKRLFLEMEFNEVSYKPFDIVFEDYNGKKMSLSSEEGRKYTKGLSRKISLSFKQFPIRKSKIDFKRLKQISFSFEEDTNIELTKLYITKK